MYSARNRTGAAALAGAAVTGLIAFALFLAGGLLLWGNAHYKDSDGFLSTGSERLTAPAYAITADDLNVSGGHDWVVSSDRYGTIRVSAASRAGKPVFVGVARTRDVDAYLRDVAHSELTDFEVDPFRATYAGHGGSRAPGAPGAQRIWAARADGAGKQSLTWDVR